MSILFENCGILAWRDGHFYEIRKGFLGVDGAYIDYIGAQKPSAHYDDVRDYTDRLLMPGLINCHCHAAMTLLRGVGSDLPLQEWLFDNVFPIEDRMTREDIAAGNELAMMEMIASGTTAFSDMYMEPSTLVQSNETIGMRVNLCTAVQCFNPQEDPRENDNIARSIQLYKKYNNVQSGRVHIDFGVHAEYTCTDAVTGYYANLVKSYPDARMHIHLSETEKEQKECIERHGCTPAEWFEKMGILDVPVGAAHCVWVTDRDIEILKKHGASAVHNPTSNMKLGSGFAPVQKMLDCGVNVALGTDGAASNNNLNMFEEMHLSAILQNGFLRDPRVMKPETVLRMATVNGARLQGRSDVGTLEVGKKADVIAVDFRNKPHLYPAFDSMTMLAYAAQGSDVSMTMVDGKILYENGKFMTLNPEKVFANAKKAIRRLYGEEC